jgi:hypothetical protein
VGWHAKARNKEYTPAPEGLHRAVCVDAVDLGMKDTQFGRKHKIRYVWQIEETMDDGKPFRVHQDFNWTMNKKAGLRIAIESWRGRPFASDDEAEAFDLESPLGTNCQLNVVHNKNGDTTFANVKAVVPKVKAPKGQPPYPDLVARDYIRVKDRDGYVPPEPEPEEATEPEDRTDYSTGSEDDSEVPF